MCEITRNLDKRIDLSSFNVAMMAVRRPERQREKVAPRQDEEGAAPQTPQRLHRNAKSMPMKKEKKHNNYTTKSS